MGFSPLADMSRRIPDLGRSSPRLASVSGVGNHHNAGVNSFTEATNPRREVSANYWITNEGVILPHIDETRRAWTSGNAAYPAGAAADHRNITIEVSNSPEGVRNGTWAISAAALKALIMLIGDIYKRHGLGKVTRGAGRGVGVHQDWVPTSCPGPYIMANLGTIITEAEKYRVSGGAPTVKPPAPVKPKPSPNNAKSVKQMADEVRAGLHGNGHAQRQKSLGIDAATYASVRAQVNRDLYGGSGVLPAPTPQADIARMAAEVRAGKHGNGHAQRQASLGINNATYQLVRDAVNGHVYGTASRGKSVSQMAAEVIAGKHGNGHAARQQSLGVDAATYAKVRAEVNRRV